MTCPYPALFKPDFLEFGAQAQEYQGQMMARILFAPAFVRPWDKVEYGSPGWAALAVLIWACRWKLLLPTAARSRLGGLALPKRIPAGGGNRVLWLR
jgi:hypothetical protein